MVIGLENLSNSITLLFQLFIIVSVSYMMLLAKSAKLRGVFCAAALCGWVLLSGAAYAFEARVLADQSDGLVVLDSEGQWNDAARHFSTPTRLVPDSRFYAQNQQRSPQKSQRSQSEVVRQVKRQYNAEVLKISMNQNGSAYRVRILMPNGRVREVTVSAYR